MAALILLWREWTETAHNRKGAQHGRNQSRRRRSIQQRTPRDQNVPLAPAYRDEVTVRVRAISLNRGEVNRAMR